MNSYTRIRTRSLTQGLAALLTCALLASTAKAVPYASGITDNGGTVSYILNEDAQNVKIALTGGVAVTNDLGALTKGVHTFSMGGNTAYRIIVTKSAPAAWNLISDDLNPLMRFFGPRGLAVNQNAKHPGAFGRIYIANSAAGLTSATPTASNRTVQKGIYILNADTSDTFNNGANAVVTAGISFDPANANSPFKIEMGEDGNLYIGDFSNNNSGIYQADEDATNAVQVLDGIGLGNPAVHTDINGSPIVKGSLANGDLKVWAINGQGPGTFNSINFWNIGAGPFPYAVAPTTLGSAAITTVADVQCDLDIAPDGKFFLMQNRASGTANLYEATRVNLKVFATDGTTVLWDSLSNSLAIGLSGDIFVGSRAIKLSPDGTKLALIRNDTQVWIVGLTNGIPDLSKTNLVNVFGATSATITTNGREVAFDAAGNLYASNTSFEKLRIWSPGGTTTATTSSDGTFGITVPATQVSVTATDATATEATPDTTDRGQFTITRTGDISGSLTVNYTMGGTATNGVDYVTLPGSVTFLPGATSTNITLVPIDDSVAELTETAILSLSAGANFSVTAPASATIQILDNETSEVSIATSQGRLLESFVGSTATFTVTRKGSLTSALTANMSYSGTAARGVDYNGPLTIVIPSGVATTNVNITPIDDAVYEGNEFVTNSIVTGSGYNIGSPSSAFATIIDDELPPATVFFLDNFDSIDSSTNWTLNFADGGSDSFADFGYDYSFNGIPSALHSTGGTTTGLRLRVNESSGILDGFSLSPTGQSYSGNYRLTFDIWINFNGPLAVGGVGSTQQGLFGVGTSGTQPEWPGNPASDGGLFSINGDGGSAPLTGDYNAYFGATTNSDILRLAGDASRVYTAGTQAGSRDNFDPYYAIWGSQPATASQLAAYPGPTAGANQTGLASAGTFGFAWHSVVVTKLDETVNFSIDGISIATLSNTVATPFPTTGNIFLGYYDPYASISDNPAVSFALFDNLKVTSYVAAVPPTMPHITSIGVVGTTATIKFTGGATDASSAFKLLEAAVITGPFTTNNSAVYSGSAGNFQATVTTAGAVRFYRIQR
ncbi:MAG: Calx-beta domain protein [Pedosphaera sp.]|nr:Calx-beta domain protein [Pedosphaera sp.]